MAKAAEERGIKQGRESGREEGIAAMIHTLKAMNLGRSAVQQVLVQQFHLTSVEAERKVQLYWDTVKS